MSAAAVTGLPSICSGAMYAGVPMIFRVTVTAPDSDPGDGRASPKSVTTARTPPSAAGTSITFGLLKSRWTTPTRWAAASADATCSTIGRASAALRAPVRRNRSRSVSPASSSMVRQSTSRSRSAADAWVWRTRSKMRQTLGWVTCRASWISRLKRSAAWLRPSASGSTVFRATRTPSSRSSASYTSPMPPRAMNLTMR